MVKYRPYWFFYNSAADNEPAAGDDAAAKAAAEKAAAEKAAAAAGEGGKTPPEGRKYTQAEIDAIVESERNRAKEKNNQLIEELTEKKRQVDLTEKQRTDLEERIKALRNEFLTKEEKDREERERAHREASERIEGLERDKKFWEDKYRNSQIESALLDAAIKNKAHNPAIVRTLLQTSAELVPVLDERDQLTGNFAVKVKTLVDGKMVHLDPADAVKKLKDQPNEYGHLFQGTHVAGLGIGSGDKTLDMIELAKNPEAYRKMRRAQQGS